MSLLADAALYLGAAVIAVPLANKLGLGSVLGYLIAGIVIGPLLGLVGGETADVQHFAEFGVVMMLFLVGLELRPAMLWKMRRDLLGLGGLQVALTTAAIAGAAMAFGLPWQSGVALGMILSVSSTAIVLQTFNEKSWLKTPGGQSGFSVLLAQDIAVIPMLALLPLLAIAPYLAVDAHGAGAQEATAHGGGSALAALPGWAQGLVTLAVVAGIVFGGRYVLKPIFRFIAEAKLREIFTATALLLVVGIALLMEFVGLSAALGTFLAGVVLSDSEYRHELESDIEPFKGLLLGLFFLTVGAGIDFNLLLGDPALLVGLAVGLLLIKGIVLFALGSLFGLRGADRWLLALSLAQAGEFAFVLFGIALTSQALDPQLVQIMTLVVALSMLLTPPLFILHEKVIAPRALKTAPKRPDDAIDEKGTVVIAGIGRFGQIVARLLITDGYKVVILDNNPEVVENLGKIGVRAYYGDATRPDLLHQAGLAEADLFIAALDDRDRQALVVEHVAQRYPQVTILARAHDRHHVYELEKAGATHAEREMFEASLALARRALIALGTHPVRATAKMRTFRSHDLEALADLRENYHDGGVDTSYITALRQHTDMLFTLLQREQAGQGPKETDRGWIPPPKGDAKL